MHPIPQRSAPAWTFLVEPLEPRRLLAVTAVTDTLIPAGATWRYLDNGSDAGAAWRQPAFDDASWKAGAAELGYGDGDEATAIGFGPSGTSKYITSYFRRRFDVPLATRAQYATPLSLQLKRDDGAIVYLNGREVARSNMPAGAVSSATPASVNVSGADETAFYPFTIDPGLLAEGANVLAVEVHQAAPSSADVSFDLRLTATRSVAAATDPFTVVVLPDTQYYSQLYPATYTAQTQWIVDHVASNHVSFLTHVGDVVQVATDRPEWLVADGAMDKLDGLFLPYSVALGNHDYDIKDSHAGTTNAYAEFFGAGRYAGRVWYGGSSASQRNHYQVFAAAGRAFLHITLEFEPTDADLAWAKSVITVHPDLPVIVATHSYLQPSGTRSTSVRNADGNSGEQMFQKLVRSTPQIFLVINGHFTGEATRTVTNDAGLPVIEMVLDYQGRANGGNGFLRLLEFNPAQNRIDAKTYSPTLNQYETDANSQFSVPLNFGTRFNFTQLPPPPPPPPPNQQTVTAQQGSANYAGASDTMLRQAAGDQTQGAAASLQVDDDTPAGSGADSQAVLRFAGLFGTGAPIPLGSTIQSATLTLQVTDPGSGFALHRMLLPWADGATWNGWTNGINADGAEAVASPDVTVGAGSAAQNVVAGPLQIDVTSSVRAWAAGVANWGWVLLPLAGGTDGVTFASSEAANAAARPLLTISFTPPAQRATVVNSASAPRTQRLVTSPPDGVFSQILAGPIGPLDALRLRRVGLFDETVVPDLD